ncbi:MAG: hypothetical protein K2I96_04730 [Lachnospiraceae bacterium]|nr:hypothetical protein [Lachnospiraceae bacterium]
MDRRKVAQVLEEIFGSYQNGSIQDRAGMRNAVCDLLDDLHYPEEQIVLRHAMDSGFFWKFFTGMETDVDAALRAVERIGQEGHLPREDAWFVVQCIMAARGQNPDLLMKKNVQKLQQENIGTGQQENIVQTQKTGGKEQPKEDHSIFETECRNKGGKEGKLCLYKDRLVFNQYMKRQQIEIRYDEISNINQNCGAWFFMIAGIVYIIGAPIVIALGGILVGVLACFIGVVSYILGLRIKHRCVFIYIESGYYSFGFKNKSDKNNALNIIMNEVKR